MDTHHFPIYFAVIFSIFPVILGNPTSTFASQSIGQPWPMPQVYTATADTLVLSDTNFKFQSLGRSCDILEDAFDRYFHFIFYAGKTKEYGPLKFKPRYQGNRLDTLAVTVDKPCEQYPSMDMDESYDLKVSAGGGSLTAQSVWGALRGLETFSQLVYETDDDQFQINATVIQDFPRFSWRGVLLDTSRHFLAKEAILQNLEAMAFNKMNVFHWHIVDSPSFPYQSRDYPSLSQQGAYNPYTHVYSQEVVKEVIEFARQRGIRVVPEFDTPGHTDSWGKGQPGLLAKCYKQGKFDGSYGPVDPSVNSTYTFLQGFMKEVTEIFPDKYVHLGGDEVSFSCWESNPDIQAFMKAKSFGKDYAKLEEYYMQKLLEIVSSYNSDYIIWQDVVDNGVTVKPDTVVHVWRNPYEAEMYKVTTKGLRTLLSAPWYLDMISYGADWRKFYAVEPTAFNGTITQEKLLMGGEACLWGEYVDNSNVDSRLWPRASAIAERLWSSKQTTDMTSAYFRIEEQRCRMTRRGIFAEPPSGPGSCRYEAMPYHQV